jgi:peptidyl-tRNA hydrolase, PTH1 family
MRCLIGLGNPGPEYAETRHNLGWRVIALLAERHKVRLRGRDYARFGQGRFGDAQVVLAQPLTFMNDSGHAARRLLQRYRLAPADLLVIYDDLDLDLGRMRLRPAGSPGTHNGARSVAQAVGQEFPRLRLGIGPLPPRTDPVSFVLAPFPESDRPVVDEMIARAADAVEFVIAEGMEPAMNRYNA